MYRKIGCLKPARTEKDEIGMRKNVLNNEGEDIRFVEREEIEVDLLRLRNKGEEYKEKDANNSCGFYVENGIVVNAQRYLEALKVLIEFEAAKNADADVSFAFRKHHVESLEEIMETTERIHHVVLCCGGEILKDGFLDESTKQELLEKAGGTLELQAGRALVLEREKCFVQEKWEMPGILGSHYLSPFQTTKAMFGPTKERGDKVKPEDAAKAGYYSTETAKSTLPDTQETIDFLMRELNEKCIRQRMVSHIFSHEGHRNHRARRPRERSANPRRKIPEDRSIRQQQSICRHRRRRERFTLPRALASGWRERFYRRRRGFKPSCPQSFGNALTYSLVYRWWFFVAARAMWISFLVYILEYDVPFSCDIFKALFFCLSLFFCVFFRDKEFVKKVFILS